jgi:DNA-binding NarL/FixJ family response regulator
MWWRITTVTGAGGRPGQVRLVLTGPSAVERQALGDLIGSDPGVTVVAELPSLREALHVAGVLSPDVVLAAVRFPDTDEVIASRAMRTDSRGTSMVFLTPYADFRTVAGLVMGAANGHVLRRLNVDELHEAIVLAGSGDAALDSRMGSGMLDWFAVRGLRRRELQGRRSPLTTGEARLLALITRGALDDEIAHRLGRSPGELREALTGLYTLVGDDPGFAVAGNQLAGLLASS